VEDASSSDIVHCDSEHSIRLLQGPSPPPQVSVLLKLSSESTPIPRSLSLVIASSVLALAPKYTTRRTIVCVKVEGTEWAIVECVEYSFLFWVPPSAFHFTIQVSSCRWYVSDDKDKQRAPHAKMNFIRKSP